VAREISSESVVVVWLLLALEVAVAFAGTVAGTVAVAATAVVVAPAEVGAGFADLVGFAAFVALAEAVAAADPAGPAVAASRPAAFQLPRLDHRKDPTPGVGSRHPWAMIFDQRSKLGASQSGAGSFGSSSLVSR